MSPIPADRSWGAGGTGISTATSRVVAVGRSSVGGTTGASGMAPEDGGSGAVSGTYTAWARAGSCRRSGMCGSAAEDRLRPIVARGHNPRPPAGCLLGEYRGVADLVLTLDAIEGVGLARHALPPGDLPCRARPNPMPT